MKRFLICLLCVITLGISSVAAQMDEPAADSNTYALTLSGKSETANGLLSVVVTKPSVTIEQVNLNTIVNQTALVYEIPTGADGSWSEQFILPAPQQDSDYGWYSVYVKGEAMKQFYLASRTEIVGAISAVQGATTTDELHGALVTYTTNKILPMDLSKDYAVYTNTPEKKSFVLNSMRNFVDEYETMEGEDVTLCFEKALETARYAYGDDMAIETALTDNLLEITYDTTVDKAEIAERYVTLRADETYDADDIKTTIRSAIALIKINRATKGEMTDIFEEYNDVLELDLTGDYSKVNKVNVNKELLDGNFETLDAFRDAFDVAVSKVKKSQNTRPTGNSGGGGGGGMGATIANVEITNPAANDKPVVDIPAVTNDRFDDLADADWAKDYINELAQAGVINGVGYREFAPNRTVTREEYLKMLMGAFGVAATAGETNFADVDSTAWYAPYIAWAVENGVINGVSADAFGVGQPITREQMAVITARMMEKRGISLAAEEASFTDGSNISDYAKDAVNKIYSAQIISGMPDGSFMPQDNLTRAQAAKVVCLAMKAGDLSE